MESWNRSAVILLIAVLALPLQGCGKRPLMKAIEAKNTAVELTLSTTTAGTVEAQQQAVLGFGTIGRVEKVFVQSGAQVTTGTLLAKLENRDVQSVFENATKELKRIEELFKDNLVSRANLDEAQKGVELARATLDKTEIRAPFDGIITDVNLQIGETAQTQALSTDKPPLRIVDQKPRIIKGNVDEADLAKVKIGAPARVKVLAVQPEAFNAKIDHVVPYVSTSKEQERTAKIELSLADSTKQIPAGASAEIEIIVDSKETTLAVPSRAVLGSGLGRYVYKFVDGKLKKTSVTIGIGNYDRTEILSGLKSGDTVVIPGDFQLFDGMRVKVDLQPWP